MPLQSTSQFRRSGQRDDRRRRLLADEALAGGCSAAAGGRSRGASAGDARSRHYGDAAFLDDQPRLLDFVPRSLLALGLTAVVGALGIAGLAALHRWTTARAAESIGPIAAFDLAAEASLGTWFSALTLLLAAGAAVLVFCIRRYRADDYQGRYRVWLWAAACWFLLATDRAAGLGEAFRRLMVYWTGTPLWGDGSVWWLAVGALLLGAVGSRVLLDVWESRLATCLLLAAGACCLTAVAAGQGWMEAPDGADAVMLRAVVGMSAALLLLLAVLAQARHVVLDAEGLLPQRDDEEAAEPTVSPPGRSPAAMDQAANDEEDDEEDDAEEAIDEQPAPVRRRRWFRIEPAHGTAKPAHRPPGAASPTPASTPAAQPASVAAAESSVKRKLTKQEKKALKERLLEARLQRERQQSWGR